MKNRTKDKDRLKYFKYNVTPAIAKEIRNWHKRLMIDKVITALKENNYNVLYAETKERALEVLKRLIPEGVTVGLGGSMTVAECGILDMLQNGKYTLYNQYRDGLTSDESAKLRRKGLTAQFYVTGTNAVTMDGKLVNIDGTGNRVAAITYGPEKVIIVVGINKIVTNVQEGIDRTRNRAAVLNSKRLNILNPCVKTGKCEDCKLPTRICNHLVITEHQPRKGRVTVIIVGEELGF